MQLLTQRLQLREFKPTDFQAIHEYASDPEVVKYLPWGPSTQEDTRNFLERAMGKQNEEPRRDYEVGIELRDDQTLIGGCRLVRTSDIGAGLGYILNRRFWGKGYATEAAKALVEYGFNELYFHRVYASAHPDNIASIRVLEKVGMTLEGRLRENHLVRGEYRDSLLYAILSHEWSRRK